eukprot:TRINITY_DN109358_c0_g1_i1.p1 TRINITY_DN109358_c0_g1~~TRINITY_DN109358_c0_g1_i1.p1  ORF type:complete len:369 (+),score=23.04 TRINITY_DN109358_c0_g1_i1:137-1108(+)
MFAQVVRADNNCVKAVEIHPLSELVGIPCSSLTTRFGQAFAVARDGRVFAWGLRSGDPNRPRQSCSMGFGQIITQLSPLALPSFGPCSIPVRSIATGVSHTIFISLAGSAYAVGRADHGKLGLGMINAQVLFPKRIVFGQDLFIVSAAAGAKHSLFVTSTGQVWGCGSNNDGQLPIQYRTQRSDCIAYLPIHCPEINFFCTSVAAGVSSSLYVSEIGQVYYTGTARQTDQPFNRNPRAACWWPHRIPDLRNVVEVSLSMELSAFRWEHATFRCRDGSTYCWGHYGHGEFMPPKLDSKKRRSNGPYVPGFTNSLILLQRTENGP